MSCDIRLDDELTGSSIFVEVKTTVTADRQIFPIYDAELLFAQDHEAAGTYWVVRVYSGGTEGMTMRKVESLLSQVEQGPVVGAVTRAVVITATAPRLGRRRQHQPALRGELSRPTR